MTEVKNYSEIKKLLLGIFVANDEYLVNRKEINRILANKNIIIKQRSINVIIKQLKKEKRIELYPAFRGDGMLMGSGYQIVRGN